MLKSGRHTRDREVAQHWSAGDAELATWARADLPTVPRSEALTEQLGGRGLITARRGVGMRLRPLRWVLLLVPLCAVSFPAWLLWQHQSLHVTSRNAAVRGDVADIGVRVRGIVSRVLVDVGDRVDAGDVLLELEHRHLSAEIEEAKAAVRSLSKGIDVEKVRIDLQRAEIERLRAEASTRRTAAEARTEAARLRAADAKRVLDMQRALYDGNSGLSRGVVAGSKVEESEFRWRTAEAESTEAEANALVVVQTAEQKLREAQDALRIRTAGLAALEADLDAARARLGRAEAEVASCVVRAPEAGAVVRRAVHPGVSVDLGQPVLSLWLGEELWVEAWIDEEDLVDVAVGAPALVTLYAHAGETFSGRVERIGLATDLELPRADVPRPRFTRMRSTPVVGVRVRLEERPSTLVPGLSAQVAIPRPTDRR